jgi:hypothetical protein
MSEGLAPELPDALARPEAYPDDPGAAGGVECVQTHISLVFLTPTRVYKLRKAVRLPFLDFSTRALRDADCLRELALNRRLAPDVYLGVAPVRRTPAGVRVGPTLADPGPLAPDPERLESCVVMRRLPAGRDALSLLEAGRLEPRHVEAVADALVRFHAAHGLGVPAPFEPAAWLERVRRPLLDCLATLRGCLTSRAELDAVERAEPERFAERRAVFEERRACGRAVDGHGDVHLQHVWFEGERSPPLLIDCIEFDDALRRLDVASEVAFLAMDLAYRGHAALAERFLARYAEGSDDLHLYAVVDYYEAYRALVRAKVAALAAADPAIAPAQRAAARGSAERHLALAARGLSPAAPGRLVCLCGPVGSGKSTVARALADELAAPVLRSDLTRKRLAGLAPGERAGAAPGAGLYDDARTGQVYAALLESAAPVVGSGRVCVIDASYACAERRSHVRAWAAARGVPALLVETRCPEPLARERLARRETAGSDPSDAGPGLLAWSLGHFEPPAEWPARDRVAISTAAPDWRAALPDLARRVRAGAPPAAG